LDLFFITLFGEVIVIHINNGNFMFDFLKKERKEMKKEIKFASQMDSVKYFTDVILEDDENEAGGTSFAGETLLDFLYTCDENELKDYEDDVELGDIKLSVINKALMECGIKPIIPFENVRKTFIAMVGYYLACFGGPESISALNQCQRFASTFDFPVIERDGEYEIDTEATRSAAENFARKIAEDNIRR